MSGNKRTLDAKISKEDIAYAGKYIKAYGKQYMLVPEITPRMCEGCAFYSYPGCGPSLTKYCRQGYRFKQVDFHKHK